MLVWYNAFITAYSEDVEFAIPLSMNEIIIAVHMSNVEFILQEI